jgi:ERCC4-type nuclease
MLKKTDIVALIDSREQRPLELKMHCGTVLRVEKASLVTGDYSVRGLEEEVAIERKSLDDLAGCCGKDRERFEKQMMRLLAYRSRAVVVEASWDNIDLKCYRSQIAPNAIVGTILKWVNAGVPFIMAGDRGRAGQYVARLLYGAARVRYEVLSQLTESRNG